MAMVDSNVTGRATQSLPLSPADCFWPELFEALGETVRTLTSAQPDRLLRREQPGPVGALFRTPAAIFHRGHPARLRHASGPHPGHLVSDRIPGQGFAARAHAGFCHPRPSIADMLEDDLDASTWRTRCA